MEEKMALNHVQKYRCEQTKQLLCDLLKVGGALTLVFAAPGAAPLLLKPFMTSGKFDPSKFKRTAKYVEKCGYVELRENGDKIEIKLLQKGKVKALKYSIDDIKIQIPQWWDSKWRLVTFDIPEEHRVARQAFKTKLDELGFKQIQKSIYVHPYECHNEIEFIRSLYNIRGYVMLMVVSKLEDEPALRRHFGL